jgi:hypothetical protein
VGFGAGAGAGAVARATGAAGVAGVGAAGGVGTGLGLGSVAGTAAGADVAGLDCAIGGADAVVLCRGVLAQPLRRARHSMESRERRIFASDAARQWPLSDYVLAPVIGCAPAALITVLDGIAADAGAQGAEK